MFKLITDLAAAAFAAFLFAMPFVLYFAYGMKP